MTTQKAKLEEQLKAAENAQIGWSKTAKQFWIEMENQKMVLFSITSGISGGFLVDAINEWITWTYDPATPHHALEGLGIIWGIESLLFGTVFFISLHMVVKKLDAIRRPYLFALSKHKEAQDEMGVIAESYIQESVKESFTKPIESESK